MEKARVETWLWLANALGFAAPRACDILSMYPNPEQLVRERFTTDLSLILTPGQLQALQNKEPEDFVHRAAECTAQDVHIVPYDDENYPQLLRAVPSAPVVLYARGDVTLPNARTAFAVVGTRRPSAYGVEATRAIAQGLAKAGVVLVSGLATGLDSECHKAAVQNNVPTIACIAFGHDKCYPAANRTLKTLIERQGLVLSEYPPGTDIQKPYFLQRNRIIAGLSQGLCVAEARRRSGTMNTVAAALEFGRDVFAVPGSIFSPLSEGTNHLLCDGAMPATSAQDILAWYGLGEAQPTQPQKAAARPVLSPAADAVEKALSCTPQTLSALCETTKLPPPAVMAALTELELAGLCAQQAGRQFVRQ